jgi:hypothetical protein
LNPPRTKFLGTPLPTSHVPDKYVYIISSVLIKCIHEDILQVPQTSQIVEYSIGSSKMMDLLSRRGNFYERRDVETGLSVARLKHACSHPLRLPCASDVSVRPGHLRFCMHTPTFLKLDNTRSHRFAGGRISSTRKEESAVHGT